ncbi:hypothetical protein [Actinomadura roseirufa]|uniref:hypothetical protein n=1 Tax=Actinomadura roseirufa TaxID=2094049 RepID=UPI001041951D|nr:hypothetical protein [Actinomadura roseirufa]
MPFRTMCLRTTTTAPPVSPSARRAAGAHADLTSPPTGIRDGGRHDPHEPEDQRPVPDDKPTTPSGLPVRVPQANLAEPLRSDDTAGPPDETQDAGRSPEEIKRIVGSYQRGARRGRTEAAGALGNDGAEDEEGQ